MNSLLNLHAQSVWGLTGTPNADSVRGVLSMASLFKIDILGPAVDQRKLAFFDRVHRCGAAMEPEDLINLARDFGTKRDEIAGGRVMDFCWNCGVLDVELKKE